MASDISSLSRLGTPPPSVIPPAAQTARIVDEGVGGMTQNAVAGTGRSDAARNDPMRPRSDGAAASRESGTAGAAARGRNDAAAADPRDPAVRDKLEKAVEKINELMRNDRSVLSFQIDEESERMVIRVIDAETDEVIRQIPSEETLKFAEYVEGLTGLIFNDKA